MGDLSVGDVSGLRSTNLRKEMRREGSAPGSGPLEKSIRVVFIWLFWLRVYRSDEIELLMLTAVRQGTPEQCLLPKIYYKCISDKKVTDTKVDM